MQNAANPHPFRDLDKHRGVFKIDDLPNGRLGDIQRQLENICVRLSETNKAGGNKSIHKPGQLESVDAMCVQFARLVADDDNFQSVFGFQAADSSIMSGKGFDCANMKRRNSARVNDRRW